MRTLTGPATRPRRERPAPEARARPPGWRTASSRRASSAARPPGARARPPAADRRGRPVNRIPGARRRPRGEAGLAVPRHLGFVPLVREAALEALAIDAHYSLPADHAGTARHNAQGAGVLPYRARERLAAALPPFFPARAMSCRACARSAGDFGSF